MSTFVKVANWPFPSDVSAGLQLQRRPPFSTGESPVAVGEMVHPSGRQETGEPVASLSPGAAHGQSTWSSSSVSTSDSDSLRCSSRDGQPVTVGGANKHKSPLIKYNYYDYNGARQEQPNHDMNFVQNSTSNNNNNINGSSGKVQRHLSPTFRQNLDQIVRSSLEQAAGKPASPSSPPSSPEQQQQQLVRLARRYKRLSYEQRCLRCQKTVYQMDKVGPLKDFAFYHQSCFKCLECGTKLTLKTYFNNQQWSGDREVYCHRHCPKTGPGRLDNQSVGIRAALNAPKVFEVGQLAAAGQPPGEGQEQVPQVDSRALHIQHAVQQTRTQSGYRRPQLDQRISQFINRRLEFLEPKQKLLEMRHREEEDALFRQFELKWRQEESSISDQIKAEWQAELAKLLEKYTRQLSSSIQSNAQSHHNQPQQPPPTTNKLRREHNNELCEKAQLVAAAFERQLRQQDQQVAAPKVSARQQQSAPAVTTSASSAPAEQQQQQQKMIELERLNLEKTMTIKLDRKKETLKRKLKEFERQATAELVEKQSREMLALISMKLEEYKEEQKRKIGSDLEQFEAIESLANQLGSSLQLGGQERPPSGKSLISRPAQLDQRHQLEVPAPRAPKVSKMELYNSEQPDEVFHDIDQLAINVAREDQQTFTDLVHHLTRYCLTDIEKVRALFRWITVKNLNTMQFDSSVQPDTPLGLLRGIKNGSESYHVLFKRLCSYAGLHCVVIKGYSKSAGYQPGVQFEGNRFRNSWNAVYVAGAWRFVQCNWGARHLVSVAVMQDKNNQGANGHNKSPVDHNLQLATGSKQQQQQLAHAEPSPNLGRSHQHLGLLLSPNHGRRGAGSGNTNTNSNNNAANHLPAQYDAGQLKSYARHSSPPISGSSSSASSSPGKESSSSRVAAGRRNKSPGSSNGSRHSSPKQPATSANNDSLRYEYDDHYFLTDPDEFIYEFFPLSPEWQLIRTRPISLNEFEQLPFVRSLFFKYGLYFPQNDIRSVLYTDSSGATTIKIGMPTQMVPSLIFHYNLKYYGSDLEHHEGVSLKRFVMQSVESGDSSSGQGGLLSNIVSFRVHLPETGAYILDIFANSTTPSQYITGEPMKFKSVCKFKIVARSLETVMVPLPDCASGEFGPMKATRLFGIIPLTHESGLISVQNGERFLEIQLRMTRPLLDFMASLHKNGYEERQLSKAIKIFIDGDIVFVTVKFFEDGQYGLDIYTRDQLQACATANGKQTPVMKEQESGKKQLLTHCCKYLINVRSSNDSNRK